ncbi:MAG: hypothetical protein ACI8TP_000049 [Acidimicrobiales bacterium]
MRRHIALAGLLICSALAIAVPTGAQVTLQAPETRQTAAPDAAADLFTDAAYQLFLGRSANPAELSAWRVDVSFGVDRTGLTRGLANSDEWLGVFIDDLYQAALDRPVEPAGRTFWIQRLQSGQLTRHVAASVYGANEAYLRAGGTDEAYVSDLYRRILGRSPDTDGLAFWVGRLQSGEDRLVDVVLGLWYSPEFRALRVTAAYDNVLARAPDAAGLDYWAERLRSVDEIELAAVLAASDEFYRSATGVAAPQGFTPPSASQQSATGFSNRDASYLGNPWFSAGVANIPLRSGVQLSFRFEARQSGSIASSSFYIVENTSRSGYSSGDCGDLTVELRSDTGGAPAGVLARGSITEPCNGPRAGQWLTNLAFDAPATVAAGQTYHVVFRNTDGNPSQNWVSINLINRPQDDPAQVEFSTGNGVFTALVTGDERYAASNGGWGRRGSLAEWHPLFEVTYTGGSRQGVDYVGTRSSNVITVTPSGAVARQLLTADGARTARAVAVRPYSSAGGRLRARIARSGQVVAELNLVDNNRGWHSAVLPAALAIGAGETLTVDVIAVAGSATFRPMYRANHDDWVSDGTSDFAGGHAQVGNGTSFSDHNGDDLQDLPVYLFTG